jgi:hypothetical protein
VAAPTVRPRVRSLVGRSERESMVERTHLKPEPSQSRLTRPTTHSTTNGRGSPSGVMTELVLCPCGRSPFFGLTSHNKMQGQLSAPRSDTFAGCVDIVHHSLIWFPLLRGWTSALTVDRPLSRNVQQWHSFDAIVPSRRPRLATAVMQTVCDTLDVLRYGLHLVSIPF